MSALAAVFTWKHLAVLGFAAVVGLLLHRMFNRPEDEPEEFGQ